MTPVRLLFDEQLAERLRTALADIYPGSLHVRDLGAAGAPDTVVWKLAHEHRCLLVTKDEDFHRLAVLRGAPPQVIWIRLGNCATDVIEGLLREHHDSIAQFAGRDDEAVLELG